MQSKESAFEIALVFALILAQIWIFRGKNYFTVYLALAVIFVSWVVHKVSVTELGLVNVPLAVVAATLVLGKILIRASVSNFAFSKTFAFALPVIGYSIWALFQELILNGFFTLRLRALGFSEIKTCLGAGIIFCLLHFPNPFLALVTLPGGTLASLAFLRMKRRNVFLIAAAHVAIALILLHAFPYAWHHHFVVGPSYYAKR